MKNCRMIVGSFVVFAAVAANAVFAQADPSALDRVELTEPLIVVDDIPFYSWEDYKSSEQFKSRVLRCGTVPDRAKAAALQAGTPADCTFFTTNPASEYDPAIVRYRIPIVVHVIRQSNGVTGHISESMVQSQIDILNEDFLAILGTNGGNGTDIQIEFYLATEDPNGQPTNGITYSNNSTWYSDGGGYYNTLAWDTNRYMNIYTNNASGNLGYVPNLPQSGIAGSNSDRVVVLWSTFGRNGPFGPPFNLGRTATHEVGHYLGLEHTFNGGCASPSNCYNNGDLICDTNPEGSPASGCFDNGSCSSPNPIDNYMDYSDDSCMEKFTPEQARRMRCSLEHYRSDLYEIAGSASCGNDVRENFEECDGIDDAACPGLCQGDCFCPDICFVAETPTSSADIADIGSGSTNRYLSVSGENAGISVALRVQGDSWTAWVGEPVEFSESSGVSDPNAAPGADTFYAATLECEPQYLNWAEYGSFFVYDESIVPGSDYVVQAIRTDCDTALPGDFSAPLELRTSNWADVGGPYDAGLSVWSPPDGSVGIPSDVVAMIDKFQNLTTAPIKARVDIDPAIPNFVININDVSRALSAFQGSLYPYSTSTAPCP